MIAAQNKHLSHPDLPIQVELLQKEEKFLSRAPIKTSPAHLFSGPTYSGAAGKTRYLLPTSSGGNHPSGGLLLRQQGEARLRGEARSLQEGEAELRGEERQLRRFEGRVRVLSTSNHSQHKMKRSSRANRSNSTCSFTSTKRRRRRRGRSFAEGGGLVERRSGQYCTLPPPTVSPLRPAYPYKTLYPGII